MGLFWKNKKKDINVGDNSSFTEFIKTFKPDDNLTKPTKEELEQFSKVLPLELLNFWKEYGFGDYGNGIIKVINPLDYMANFYDWLGLEDFSKIPILMTGFGDIFYYRKLQDDAEDVCILDIHYRKCIVCSYSLHDFFNSYIVDKEICADLLKKDLFEQAYKTKGKLQTNQIYFFVPALILGGGESIEYIGKGDANVHQDLLLQLVN